MPQPPGTEASRTDPRSGDSPLRTDSWNSPDRLPQLGTPTQCLPPVGMYMHPCLYTRMECVNMLRDQPVDAVVCRPKRRHGLVCM